MTHRRTGAKITQRDNEVKEFQLVQQEDDVPLPPAEELGKLLQLEKEYNLNRLLLDTTISMVKEENTYRRKREKRVDWFVFIERVAALVIVLAIALCAFCFSYQLALAGHEWTAGIISGGTLALIISAILKRK